MMRNDAYIERSGATDWWIVTTRVTRPRALAEIEFRKNDFAMVTSIAPTGRTNWDVWVRILQFIKLLGNSRA